MAPEWHEVPFQRLLTEPVRNGIYKRKEFHGRGAKIVNMGELFGHPRLRAVPMKRVELTEDEVERFTIARGDLLFARRSLVAEGAGKCSVVLDVDEPTTFESSIIRARPDTSKADPIFLYYFFSSGVGLHRLDTIRRQVAVAGITGTDLSRLEISVPSLAEQHTIAHILGALDDKIELNLRMSETLESMAHALFKSWFVDFDPVHSKKAGRDPHLPRYIAELFPDGFVDSGLGQIPEDWETGSILNQARLLSGGTPKTNVPAYWDGNVPWASAKDISQCGEPFLVWTERTITTRGLEESATQIIPALSTVVVARGATTGRMAMCGREMAMNQTCYGLTTTTNTPFALHCRLRHEIDALVHAAHGSVFDTITTKTFSTSNVVVAPLPLLQCFEAQAAPFLQRVLISAVQSRTLATLRNELLPRLISGKLRVKDAESFLERAV